MINNTMELTFQAHIACVKVAVASVLAYANCFNISFNENNISAVIEEAVSNVVQHAYPHDSNGRVIIKAFVTHPNILTVKIIDNGVGIEDIDKVKEPFYTRYKDSKLSEHSGMGMTIIEQFSDSLDIWSKPNLGTEIVVDFKGIV